MIPIPYKIIKTEKQYMKYCNELEHLVKAPKQSPTHKDAIELLTLLIEKWDAEHSTLGDADPVELLRYLMTENDMKAVALAKLLEISTSLMSDILNYRRGLSKEIIRKLSEKFKVGQDLFNRPYQLTTTVQSGLKKVSKADAKKKNGLVRA